MGRQAGLIACALEISVGSIECDVALSVDDAVVLSHDGTVPTAGRPPWGPAVSLVRAELLARLHAEGLPVIPWTINDPARVRELLKAGVDGVCTDRPDLIRATLAAQGVALPPRHRAPAWLGHGWQAWPDTPASSA